MLRQSEKMATLGTLAAGVAHELNNPAAATRRAAEQLRETSARFEDAERAPAIGRRCPPGRASDASRRLRKQARARGGRAERSRRPRARATGRQPSKTGSRSTASPSRGVSRRRSPSRDSTPPALSTARGGRSRPEALAAVLEWAGSLFPVYTLLNEIGQGSARISEIVGALKSYSYLGQAPVQTVDLHEGLDNTLVILRGKLKAGISVRRDYGADVPKVPAHGSELNQVWTNILDNAADAMDGKGTITIRTRREGLRAVVEIEDDGPGIPRDIVPRIFDPFFTTKAPGQGHRPRPLDEPLDRDEAARRGDARRVATRPHALHREAADPGSRRCITCAPGGEREPPDSGSSGRAPDARRSAPRAARVACRPRPASPAGGGRARLGEGPARGGPLHRPLRPHVDLHRPRRRTAQGVRVARGRRRRHPAVLAPQGSRRGTRASRSRPRSS